MELTQKKTTSDTSQDKQLDEILKKLQAARS